jgi:LmbE family N-acetylglucosaminyl deacetylase/predicted DCC family thiol-disulfide oxidoreductase YuxK
VTDDGALLVYDGDCGFCTTCARWVERHLATPARVVPFQQLDPGALGRLGLSAAEVRTAAWWVEADGRRRRGHRAIARALGSCGGGWAVLGRVLGAPPLSWLGVPAYSLMSRYRHRLPGGTPACGVPMPRPEAKGRGGGAGRPLTLLAVHAHPDDETLFGGGVLARSSDEGVRTVVVTCTGGELGFGPDGTLPGSPGRDDDAVGELRRGELAESCRILGVGHLELLGYRDSGMAGWAQNRASGAFCGVPVGEAAARLGEVLARERPDVVVTYGADGFYGHPDHIQAHRVAMAAIEALAGADPAWRPRVFFVAMTRAALAGLVDYGRVSGTAMPEWVAAALDRADGVGEGGEASPPPVPITALVDCTGVVERTHAALAAHASQIDNAALVVMDPAAYRAAFGVEAYAAAAAAPATAPAPAGGLVTDLFAGLR